MNNMIFRTNGDWDTTTLYSDGIEVSAAQLFVEIRAGRDAYGNIEGNGIWDGADFTAIVRTQDDPETPLNIFPGRLTMQFPGHELIVENIHPLVEPDTTRIWYNGDDVTNRVVDVYVDVNALDNVVSAFVTVYKTHWFRTDELITYTIFG